MTDERRSPGTRAIAATVLAVVFLAGALVGVVAERAFLAKGPPITERPARDERGGGPRPPGGPGGPAGPDGRIFAADSPIAQRLNLTEDQRSEIDRIIEEDRAKASAMLDQMRPALQARYDSTTAAIRQVLTEEQREEFDQLRQERMQQLRRRFGENRSGDREDGNRRRPFPGF